MIDPGPRPELDPELAALLQPLDEHNRSLIDNVRPLDWVNPKPAERYHLVIIGAGTGGLVSAAGAAGLGAKVALIERRFMGGDCLNHGCVPPKGMIRAARAWHDARTGPETFGSPPVTGEGDFARAMARMRGVRAHISRNDSARRFRDLGVDVFIGDGRFVAPNAVEVAGERLRFRRAIIATGGRPTAPPIPGLEEAGYLTNETVFTLTELPRRLAIIGDGAARADIEALMAPLGEDRVRFLGQRETEELPGLLSSADLFVWPAVGEAYGMAILEAQAAGVPVVAGNAGGVDEIVRHGVTGVLTPEGSVAAFADAITKPSQFIRSANEQIVEKRSQP